MNPQDPLAALHPLRNPDAIGWWPLAPGWWALIFITILLLLLLAWYLYRRYQSNAYRRNAQSHLDNLYLQWKANQHTPDFLEATNALLKKVAMQAYPDQKIAGSSGREWVDFLNRSLPERYGSYRFSADFAESIYRPKAGKVDCKDVHHGAALWIRKHGETHA